MSYILEYNIMLNESSVKKDSMLERLCSNFKKHLLKIEYEVIWVKDKKGKHIVQVFKEPYSNREAQMVGNLNLAGKAEVLIDGSEHTIGSMQLYRMRKIKKEKGIVNMYSIDRLGGLDIIDF